VSKHRPLHATSPNPKKKSSKAPLCLKRPNKTPTRRPSKANSPKAGRKSQVAPKKASPVKANPKVGTPEFFKLQQEWYKKAAQSGFQDIESINPQSGNSYKYLNTQSNSRLNADKIASGMHYYRRWTCFLAHNPRFSTRQIDLDMARMWAEGATWAEIKRELKPKYSKGVSDWSINKFLREMEPRVKRWNRVHKEGLDFEPELDLAPE
jgi:hypothetical protein